MLKSSAEFLLIYLIVSLYSPICLSPSALSCLELGLGAPYRRGCGAPHPTVPARVTAGTPPSAGAINYLSTCLVIRSDFLAAIDYFIAWPLKKPVPKGTTQHAFSGGGCCASHRAHSL